MRKFDVDVDVHGTMASPDRTLPQTKRQQTAAQCTSSLNFLPNNLAKQFRQAANSQFLLIVCGLQCAPAISITGGLPATGRRRFPHYFSCKMWLDGWYIYTFIS
jgi:hypothetical protein